MEHIKMPKSSAKEKISFDELAILHRKLYGFDDPYLVERVYQCLKFFTPRVADNHSVELADFGCGDFRASRLISLQIPKIKSFYCVDISLESVDEDTPFNVLIHDLNYGDLSITSNSLDFVYGLEVIEHLWNTDVFISNIHRILKPKGLLLLTTPNLNAWYNRFLVPLGVLPIHYEVSFRKKYGRILKRLGEGDKAVGHIRVFTPYALSKLLEDNGFEILNCAGLRFLFSGFVSGIDRVFAAFPSLSSMFLILAKKR